MSLYQHFRQEEHAFIDLATDWKELVENEYRPKLTDFLDPREQHILRSLIGEKETVSVAFSGGSLNAERKRALIYPDYVTPEPDDFEVDVFEIHYPRKFVQLEHPKILGSLMGLGLKRGKFGDILSDGGRYQIAVCKDIADYIELNFTAVGKTEISLSKPAETDRLEQREMWEEKMTTVSSLRLDVILKEAFHLSRAKTKPLIQNERVKVNWRPITDPSFSVEEKDMISVRGFGRVSLQSIEGETRKGRYRVMLAYPA
ncbi:RNA-binding protein [Salisediminibacterium halotolerans]|uniref:YlmH family RNA-binding protein n=1 Tax=Salisediminibacterium halotolerans TaxID=517425 RepID=UPI000EAC51A6|nr:RNA-binding protein [Salisediminibacterium halotolerans]RLJ74296.1 RNA-binding protein YlmH [Actinophytocola xinjiangensis]RPE87611.1 RNA-binding protein YlmH [Salisediminibacterium halotolerans]TWG35133.1 RNA-binding protein YlmH [Salisediminibacterium halotolerans]GEL07308.1 RNA-binding protein S4 [Salisediminibacterium halotolerans]